MSSGIYYGPQKTFRQQPIVSLRTMRREVETLPVPSLVKGLWTFLAAMETATVGLMEMKLEKNCIYVTRSLGARRAPTSRWRPYGSLDFVLRATQTTKTMRITTTRTNKKNKTTTKTTTMKTTTKPRP